MPVFHKHNLLPLCLYKLCYISYELSYFQKVEAPVEVKEVNIIGACVEGDVVTFLQDDDEVQMADLKIVTDALPDVENVEQHILGLCNPSASVRVSLKGSDVIKLEFM